MLLPGTRLHWGFGLALIVAAGLAVIFRRARFGFQLRAVGSSLQAAASAGRINVRRVIFITFLGSGAIAGIAGGTEVAGVTFALYEGLSPGWGYTAIAVALLAGLDPLGIVFSGILFAALHAGSAAMQRDAGVPLAWVGVVEAIVILAVLVIIQKRHARSGGGGL
jgi:simple sugar transport system permease protein